MSSYINISLDLSIAGQPLMDFRVPVTMTLVELLKIISESYGLDLRLTNPVARQGENGYVLSTFEEMGVLKDGDLVTIETL